MFSGYIQLKLRAFSCLVQFWPLSVTQRYARCVTERGQNWTISCQTTAIDGTLSVSRKLVVLIVYNQRTFL